MRKEFKIAGESFFVDEISHIEKASLFEPPIAEKSLKLLNSNPRTLVTLKTTDGDGNKTVIVDVPPKVFQEELQKVLNKD